MLFETFWPKIGEEYNAVISIDERSGRTKRNRSERELLEEILFRVRGIEKQEVVNKPYPGVGIDSLMEMPVNFDTLSAYSNKRFPNLKTSSHWQSQLLADLNTQNYPYVRDIDNVLNMAMPALEVFSREAPDLFQHSTDYLTKALGFVDREFRDVHPWGLRTQEAFVKLSELVKKL